MIDEGKGKEAEIETKVEGDVKTDQVIYPYWKKVPPGWDYPAACASGLAGKGGWAASVDREKGMIFHGHANCRNVKHRCFSVCRVFKRWM